MSSATTLRVDAGYDRDEIQWVRAVSRAGLAHQARFVGKVTGFREYAGNDLWTWVIRRVPRDVKDVWRTVCWAGDASRIPELSSRYSPAIFDFLGAAGMERSPPGPR